MWTHEQSIEIAAMPSRIWSLFADVPGWKRWNAGIENISMHGSLTIVGETRVLVHHTMVLLTSNRTRVSYRTEVFGPDAEAVGPMVTADFPDVLRALKDHAEREA